MRRHIVPFASVLISLLVGGVGAAGANAPITATASEIAPPPSAPATRSALSAPLMSVPTVSDLAPTPARSQSVGLPWQGRLPDGVLMEESPTVRYVNERPPAEHFYGTAELVGLLEIGAQHVAQTLPGGARLTVGDLSKHGGGDILSHRSHENGRDVDLGF